MSVVSGLDSDRPVDAIFVNAPLKDYGVYPRHNDYALPVIGLGYIATFAKQNGFNVGVIDAENLALSPFQVAKEIGDLSPRWVGVNLLAPTYQLAVAILQQLQGDIMIMLGGHQAKAMPARIASDLDIPHIDALIVGEAETRVACILGDLDARRRLPAVRWRDRETGKIEEGKAMGSVSEWLAPDLNMLPYVDRTYFGDDPLEVSSGIVESSMVGSRGCPYNCSFCGAAASANPDVSIRTRRIDNIIGEMSSLAAELNVNRFRFVDDLFLAVPAFVERWTSTLTREGYSFSWAATGRINVFAHLSDETMVKLKSAGCREVALGVESGDARVLNYMGKHIDPAMTESVVERLLRSGIAVKAYYIFGFPTESREEMLASMMQIRRLWDVSDKYASRFRASVFEFRPYPGTLEWKRLIDNGFSERDMLNYSHVDLTEHGALEVMRERDEFNFSVNLRFAEATPGEIRQALAAIVKEQSDRSEVS